MTTLIKPSTELINSAKKVFVAMAYVQTIKPTIEDIQKRVLEKGQYKWNDKHDRELTGYVDDPFKTYLMHDTDFNDYLIKCHQYYLEAGFKDLEFGYCPLLIAEDNQRKAEREMLLLSKELSPTFDVELVYYNPKNYRKYVDLTLKYLVSFI